MFLCLVERAKVEFYGRRRVFVWSKETEGTKERRRSKVVLDVNVLLGSTIMIGRTCTFDQAKWVNVQAYIKVKFILKVSFCHFCFPPV